jgi:hypothetical protein
MIDTTLLESHVAQWKEDHGACVRRLALAAICSVRAGNGDRIGSNDGNGNGNGNGNGWERAMALLAQAEAMARMDPEYRQNDHDDAAPAASSKAAANKNSVYLAELVHARNVLQEHDSAVQVQRSSMDATTPARPEQAVRYRRKRKEAGVGSGGKEL